MLCLPLPNPPFPAILYKKKAKMQIPLVTEIKGNSLDDGPGIRTVIFFKGCPLNCVWCQNPENKKPGAEISFDPELRIGARECVRVCPEKAIDPRNPYYIDKEKCTFSGDCVKVCPSKAITIVGRTYAVDKIVDTVLKDRPFFEVSGGGATLSGGEPMIFMDFAHEVVKN